MEQDIKKYDKYVNLSYNEGRIPDSVRHDLNIDDVFSRVDYTASCVGRQLLYHLICTDKQSEIVNHEELISHLKLDIDLIKQILSILARLNKPASYSIVDLLSDNHSQYTANYIIMLKVCRWLPLLLILSFVLFQHTALLFMFVLMYIFNCYIHYRQKSKLFIYYFSIPQLATLLESADRLSKVPYLNSMSINNVESSLNEMKELRGKLRSFRIGQVLDSDIAMPIFWISELFSILTLHAANNVMETFILIKKQKNNIEQIFRFTGFVDVLNSVAFLRERLPYYCMPSLINNKESEFRLHIKSVFHPLIDNCVPNDIQVKRKSILITGSNMSGKTSCIRTVAINIILAKSLNTCCAYELRVEMDRRIHSVIHTEDDILNGKSFFQKETENVKLALDLSMHGKYIIIFDELFKGTNTRERVAINAALLRKMSENDNIIMVSTHDKELTDLLHDSYEFYYFSETIVDNMLTFDYKIKNGIAGEGNAIKILSLYGFPSYITDEAYSLVKD